MRVLPDISSFVTLPAGTTRKHCSLALHQEWNDVSVPLALERGIYLRLVRCNLPLEAIEAFSPHI